MTKPPILEVQGLDFAYRHGHGWRRVLHNVTCAIQPGEVFGLVGESGCGKSTLALAILGHVPSTAAIQGGQILFDGRDILTMPRAALDRLRGRRIAFVPQNPTTALSPHMRVGTQIAEGLRVHGAAQGERQAHLRVIELFEQVGLPQPDAIGLRYPHELSGGQQQRVCIAIALACNPDLIVLDEPTTGLDVTTQDQIIRLLADLRRRLGSAMLYVTHDLGVLAQIADRVGVMYAGRMMEIASTGALFEAPLHPYARGLIDAVPSVDEDTPPIRPMRGLLRRDLLPPGCPFTPRCDYAEPQCEVMPQSLIQVTDKHMVACHRWQDIVALPRPPAVESPEVRSAIRGAPLLTLENVSLSYGRRGWLPRRRTQRRAVVTDANLVIHEGETFALVGESGSGKSTIAKAISGVIKPLDGRITFRGAVLPARARDRTRETRRLIQYVFQNPDASLNPRDRIGSVVGRPVKLFFALGRDKIRHRVVAALDDVRLDESYLSRFPDQLSGGERQRVAIARALAAEPELLLCDEVLSALDVSVQANIIDLLIGLRRRLGVAMLFISHDLAVVRGLADSVGVLYQGRLMEMGEVDEVFRPPFHPYTHALLLASPSTKRRAPIEAPQPADGSIIGGRGCPFSKRCPSRIGAICDQQAPPVREAGRSLRIACHLDVAQLTAAASPPPVTGSPDSALSD